MQDVSEVATLAFLTTSNKLLTLTLHFPLSAFHASELPNTCSDTAQKMKFIIKDFFSKYDQIRRKLWIWSHLLKKSLLENFI